MPTSATTEVEYEYDDANWPEKPTEIRSVGIVDPNEPRVEQFTYNASHGGLLEHSITGKRRSGSAGDAHQYTRVLRRISAFPSVQPGGQLSHELGIAGTAFRDAGRDRWTENGRR